MVTTNISSKVIVQEAAPNVRQLQAAPTSITGFLGLAERGPMNTPTRVTNANEFRRFFGNFTASSDLALAVAGFFGNGGRELWIVRTAHHTDIADPNTNIAAKGSESLITPGAATAGQADGSVVPTWIIVDGSTLVVNVDGGGNVTATFNSAAALLLAANTENYALVNGQTLTFIIDSGLLQTITFLTGDFSAIGAATAAEVAVVVNRDAVGLSADTSGGAPRLTSDKKGTGSRIEVTGGTANAALGFSTTPVSGSGDVADDQAVTLLEAETVIEGDIAGLEVISGPGGVLSLRSLTTGPSSSILVDASSDLDSVFGLDNVLNSGVASGSAAAILVEGKTPGAYANDVDALVLNASSGISSDFNLQIKQDGVNKELFVNLSTLPTSTFYFESIVNNPTTGSNLVVLTDQGLGGNPRPINQTITLSGGDDGLAGLVDIDFLGNLGGLTALHAFDNTSSISLFAIPGRATVAVHQGLVDYCEIDRKGRAFAVIASVEGQNADAVATYVESTASLLQRSEFGAIYWPHVKVINPDRAVFGDVDQITVSPEGHLVGMYARTDAARVGGVFDPPAGIDVGQLFGVVGLETDEAFNEAKRDIVAARNINPLNLAARFYADGVRCLRTNFNFPSVAERRGVIFIETTIASGVEFARFKNNSARLRGEVRRTIINFLNGLTALGAFRSDNPSEAFQVTTPVDTDNLTTLFVEVALATAKPTELIVLTFSQDTATIEASLA